VGAADRKPEPTAQARPAAGATRNASAARREAPASAPVSPLAQAEALISGLLPALPAAQIPPARLAELQSEYLRRWQQLVSGASQHRPDPHRPPFCVRPGDSGPFSWTAALYLLNGSSCRRWPSR
jgi:hypothetical protein